MTDTVRRKSLLDECKTVAENSLYTAQAHFSMAARTSGYSKLFFLFPAVVAGISGILTSVGLPGWFGAFGSAAGLVIAVATFLGVDQKEMAHKTAGNLFTCLRHEARALHETFHPHLTDEQLLVEVRLLSDRYNSLVLVTEVSNKKAFEEARKKIKSRVFDPDFRNEKNEGR